MSTGSVSEGSAPPALATITEVRLNFPARERVKAAIGALTMPAVGLMWAAFMLNVALSRSQTPPQGRPVALALALLAVPFLWWGLGYWRRLTARAPSLRLTGNRLVIDHEIALRRPLELSRSEIAGVAVDDVGLTAGRDALRFPIVSDLYEPTSGSARWLYSRYSGAPFPTLAEKEQSPNVALLFARPLLLDAARLDRRRPLQVNGGTYALYRDRLATGVLLAVEDIDAIRALLGPWKIERPVTEGDLTVGRRPETYPSLAPPAGNDEVCSAPARPRGLRASRGFIGILAVLYLSLGPNHHESHAATSRPVAITLATLLLVFGLSRAGRAMSTTIAARVPFAIRVLVLYPLLGSAMFAFVTAYASFNPSRAAAYVVLPLALSAVLALTDASAQRASPNNRVAWALLGSLPTLALCRVAVALVT